MKIPTPIVTAGLALALIVPSTVQASNLEGDLPAEAGTAELLQGDGAGKAPAGNAPAVAAWCTESTGNALVTYYISGGWFVPGGRTFRRLVVYRDRTASLCWGFLDVCDPPSPEHTWCPQTGRSDFMVSPRTMSALILQLERIGVRRLGKAPPQIPEADSASLVYKGISVPVVDGYPAAQASIQALNQAKTILDRMTSTHRTPA